MRQAFIDEASCWHPRGCTLPSAWASWLLPPLSQLLRRICQLNTGTHTLKHRQNLSEITVYLNPSVYMYEPVYVCVCLHEAVSLFTWSLNISSPTLLREISPFHFIPLQCPFNTPRLPLSTASLCSNPKISCVVVVSSLQSNSSDSSSFWIPSHMKPLHLVGKLSCFEECLERQTMGMSPLTTFICPEDGCSQQVNCGLCS